MKKAELLKALAMVMPGVGEKSTLLEGANSFMLDGDWVKTFNDEISVSFPFPVGVKCMVKAQEFFKIVSRIDSEDIRMVILDDGRLQLSGGKTTLKMVSSDPKGILALVDNLSLSSVDWVKLPADFKKALNVCSGFAATNSARIGLYGVSVGRDGLTASDGVKAGFYSMEIPSLESPFIIPTGSVRELLKFGDVSEFALGDSWIHFKSTEGVTFSARKVGAEFPRERIRDLINFDNAEKKVYSFPPDLVQSVLTASVMSCSTDSGVEYVDISLDKKGNLIVSGAKSFGEVKDKILPDKSWDFPEGVIFKINPANLAAMFSLGREFYIKEKKYMLMKVGDFESILALSIG